MKTVAIGNYKVGAGHPLLGHGWSLRPGRL